MEEQKKYAGYELWFKANKKQLINYKAEWIAFNETGVVSHDPNYIVAVDEAKKSGKKYVMYFVHPAPFDGIARFLKASTFRANVKTFHSQEWYPHCYVDLFGGKNEEHLKMLIDSGADFSVISYKVGSDLGFTLGGGEKIYQGGGVGDCSFEFAMKEVEMEVEGHRFKAPIAWLLDEKLDESILGRDVVFDLFDIEFKQADEEVIFKWRGENPSLT
jgi:Aspartyl protease/Family of unknown function (DUF5678)